MITDAVAHWSPHADAVAAAGVAGEGGGAVALHTDICGSRPTGDTRRAFNCLHEMH